MLVLTDSIVYILIPPENLLTEQKLYIIQKGYKSTSGLTSYKWSATIHPYIRSATGFTNRGLVDRTGLYVLRHSKTASTLTEIGLYQIKVNLKK